MTPTLIMSLILTGIIIIHITAAQMEVGTSQQYLYRKVVTQEPVINAYCLGGRIEYRQGVKFCCYDKEITECYKIVTQMLGDEEVRQEIIPHATKLNIMTSRALVYLARMGRRGIHNVLHYFANENMTIPSSLAERIATLRIQADEFGA